MSGSTSLSTGYSVRPVSLPLRLYVSIKTPKRSSPVAQESVYLGRLAWPACQHLMLVLNTPYSGQNPSIHTGRGVSWYVSCLSRGRYLNNPYSSYNKRLHTNAGRAYCAILLFVAEVNNVLNTMKDCSSPQSWNG